MATVGGRYQLDGRLGEGGMGHVYRARHLQLGKPFALKLIAPAFADDGLARARFNQEAKLASEISHPNIVSVVDFGEDPQFGAYMVMELVEGEPLARAHATPMSIRRAIDVLVQVSDALDHIHKRGIVHGDVKADNILLSAEAGMGARRRHVVRLLDFGLARRAGGSDRDDQVSGSPHYLAPERAGGGPPSVATDIYALGVLGYLMLTGTLPFTGNVVEVLVQHLQQAPDRLSVRRGEPIDDALEALIMRAMAKDPGARHASVSAFRYELNTVMDMLDMGRRKRTSPKMQAVVPRDALTALLFDGSSLPQMLVSPEGTILLANPAVRTLLGGASALEGIALADTVLASYVPGLVRAVRSAAGSGKPAERKAQVHRGGEQSPLGLTIWMSPVAGDVHVLVRVEE